MLRKAAVLGVGVLAGVSLGDSQYSQYSPPAPQDYSPSGPASEPAIAPILIGVLVLSGLALLFPTYITLTSVRRRRSAEGSQGKRSMVTVQYFSHDIQVRLRLPRCLCGC